MYLALKTGRKRRSERAGRRRLDTKQIVGGPKRTNRQEQGGTKSPSSQRFGEDVIHNNSKKYYWYVLVRRNDIYVQKTNKKLNALHNYGRGREQAAAKHNTRSCTTCTRVMPHETRSTPATTEGAATRSKEQRLFVCCLLHRQL